MIYCLTIYHGDTGITSNQFHQSYYTVKRLHSGNKNEHP